jgi:hypothetical protein
LRGSKQYELTVLDIKEPQTETQATKLAVANAYKNNVANNFEKLHILNSNK